MSKVFFNNELLDRNDIVISIDDRSFRYGDGCFETIPFYFDTCFEIDLHLERLVNGLKDLKIQLDISNISNQINELIQTTNYSIGFIRINCSRGSGSNGFLPTYKSAPYYIIEVLEKNVVIPDQIQLFVSNRPRISAQQLPIQSKLNNGLNSILARIEAQEHNCFEALQLTSEDYISEGSSSNICWIKNNVLYTPSEKCDLLKGITQTIIEQISPFKVEKGEYIVADLFNSDEIFLSNASWEIIPVSTIYNTDWKSKTNHYDKFCRLFNEYVKQKCLSL